MSDLQAIRALISARRERASVIEVECSRIQARIKAHDTEGWVRSTYRCTNPQHRRARPKVAEIIHADVGSYFISKIAWLPSDQLTLTPWERELYLGVALTDGALQSCMTDDAYLRDWIDHLDQWSAGLPADGPRWLLSRGNPPFTIRERVESPRVPAALSMWVRCKVHPKGAEIIDAETALRESPFVSPSGNN